MRILVFSWRDPKHPLAGGAEQVMHEHMKGWVTAGYDVTLFSSRIKGLKEKEVLDGIEVVRGGYQYLGVQVAGFLFYLKNKNNFDFIVDQFHGLPFFTPLYVRRPKLAVIQETARKVWFLNPLPWPINWVIGLLGYWVEPLVFLLYKSTPFMTASESAKKDVVKMGMLSKNITLVPHGVIVPKFSVLQRKEKIKTVVFLGVLSKDKGIEDAIRCFSILNGKGEYQFWVIGKAEIEEYGIKIKKMVRALNLGDKVKFWGFVSQEKKFELLSRAHVLVNPSVHEGWGLVNIEANAVGTPVVAYNVSGSVDSVKDGISGILCKENTPEDLADKVVNLLSHKRKYEELQKSSISWSRAFSWEKSQKLSLELIRRVTNAH